MQRALQVQEADWIQQAGQQEEEEEELIPLDDFYCPLCDKSFKSQKALANHERLQTPLPSLPPPIITTHACGPCLAPSPLLMWLPCPTVLVSCFRSTGHCIPDDMYCGSVCICLTVPMVTVSEGSAAFVACHARLFKASSLHC